MKTSKAVYLGDLRTEITHLQSGTKIYTDSPVDNGGKGSVFSPTDLFAASYGSCALTIIGIAAKTHGFTIDGAEVSTTKVMGTNPRRVVELILEFAFPHNNYSEKERKIIELSVKECPVANSISPEIKITKSVIYKS